MVATGPRPMSSRDSTIGPDASAFGLAVSSSSASATSRIFSSSSSRFSLLLGGHLGELRRAPPVLGLQALRGELALHAVGVRVRQVDLVDRDDDRHLGRPRVRDRLLRLRHDAVVGGDHEDGDVRHLRAAGTHGGERLVAGRVEERHLAPVDLGLVGADVLGDARRPRSSTTEVSRIASSSVVLPWSTWPMIVTTGGRGARSSSASSNGFRLRVLVGGVLDRHLAPDLGRDQLDLVVGERLRRGPHLAEAHQDRDDLAASARRGPARGP